MWEDVRYFPLLLQKLFLKIPGWQKENIGGNRSHEGTDLFGTVRESGYYPVISMTDGTVEQKGWLPLGGYRIGIRSPHGGYFIMRIFPDMKQISEKGRRLLPETFWDIWEIPDTDLREPEGNFRYIFIWNLY